MLYRLDFHWYGMKCSLLGRYESGDDLVVPLWGLRLPYGSHQLAKRLSVKVSSFCAHYFNGDDLGQLLVLVVIHEVFEMTGYCVKTLLDESVVLLRGRVFEEVSDDEPSDLLNHVADYGHVQHGHVVFVVVELRYLVYNSLCLRYEVISPAYHALRLLLLSAEEQRENELTD